jgi:hypothetical protein
MKLLRILGSGDLHLGVKGKLHQKLSAGETIFMPTAVPGRKPVRITPIFDYGELAMVRIEDKDFADLLPDSIYKRVWAMVTLGEIERMEEEGMVIA